MPGFAVAFVLFVRFLVKNDLYSDFLFSADNVLKLSGTPLWLFGFASVATVCMLWGVIINRFLCRCGENGQGAAVLLIIFAVACPAVFPFLYRTSSVCVGDLLAQLLFAMAVLVIKTPVLRWLTVIVTAIFSFSFFLPTANAIDDTALLYLPMLLLCMSLEAFSGEILADTVKKKNKAGDGVQGKIMLFLSVAVVIVGLILRLVFSEKEAVSTVSSADSLSTVFGSILVTLPVVFFTICFYAYIFKCGKREKLFFFICVAELALLAVCIINRDNICKQCIPLLAVSQLFIVGFITQSRNSSFDRPLNEFATFFKSHWILSAVMIIYMALFTAASNGVAPMRLTDIIPY